MALIIGAVGGGQVSGSIGTMTFASNRFGQYMRNRTKPINPNTSYQQAIRSIMSMLVQYWNETLTSTQRSQWDTYAAAIPMQNRLGQTIYLTGFNHFIRSNVARQQAGLAIVADGPATLSLPPADETLAIAISEATQNITVTFNDALDWCDEDGGALILLCGSPQLHTRTFFKGPWRFADSIDGDAVTPPTTGATVAASFAIQEGQRMWVQGRIARADGRLSNPFSVYIDAGA